MRNLIGFFIKYPIWTNAFIVIISLFGLWSLVNMKSSFFPELDPMRIQISVMYPGASPQEMEEGVAIKIEQAVKGLKDIEHFSSTSSENMCTISIEAYQNADMDELLSDVENAINSINSFPQGAEKPIIKRLKTGGMASTVMIIGISLKNQNLTLMDLRTKAQEIENELLNSKSVTQIRKDVFPEVELVVEVRESDLLRYGITFDEISRAIASKNIDLTAGIIRGSDKEIIIRSSNRTTDAEELGKIVIRGLPGGQNLLLKDVADVRFELNENSELARFNGMPSVIFNIEKTTDQDLRAIAKTIKSFSEKFNEQQNEYEINVLFAFDEMLEERIDLLTANGKIGLILVLVALGLFLNLKLSAWVAFGIPFSFLGMFILGLSFGITINMITLFGMILVVGILVDDGIVIAENIFTHFEQGKSAPRAALDGTMEVLQPVFTSVLTTVVAFSLLLFIEGMEMMREMAIVVIACLVFSLFEAFFVLPSHLASKKILSQDRTGQWKWYVGMVLLALGLILIYWGSSLIDNSNSNGTLVFPFAIIVAGIVLIFLGFNKSQIEELVRNSAEVIINFFKDKFIGTSVSVLTAGKMYRFYVLLPLLLVIYAFYSMSSGRVAFTFFPNIEPDMFTIEVAYEPGENKRVANEFVDVALKAVKEENQKIINETGDTLLRDYVTFVGWTQNIGQVGNHVANIQVFCDAEGKKASIQEFMNRLIDRLEDTDEVRVSSEFVITGMSRWGKPISYGLSSTDDVALKAANKFFKEQINAHPQSINVIDDQTPGRKEMYLEMKPLAEMYGLTRADILNQVRQGFFGQEVQRLIKGTDELKLWLRYPRADRSSVSDVQNMRVKTAQGMEIPLREVADYSIGRGYENLKRRDGMRLVTVSADVRNPDSTGIVNKYIGDTIIPTLKQMFPSVDVVALGQAERSKKSGDSMASMTLIVLIIMVIIIMLHFRSLYQALLIFLVLPSGIAGAIIGHGLVGIPVSLLSAFGMIGLLGVLVNDSIVYIDRYNAVLKSGKTIREAALEAAKSRFRPILLTTVTTVAGLLPLISETSMQAQFLIPMAVSLAFGIMFGTLMVLLFYPVAILFGNDVLRFLNLIITSKLPKPLDVEPALKKIKNDVDEAE
jgi:multidrug efflux pump subunit AcrB